MKCVIQLAGKIGITTLFSLCFELRNKSVDIVGSRNRKMQIEALTVGLQKVSAQLAAASPSRGGLEANKFVTRRIRRGGPAPQVVNNP